MSTVPSISVITTIYNDGPYLSQAIESILQQTFTDFEYIIIDDGSEDETPQVLARYAEKDARIFAQRNSKNTGRASSRNQALKLARGEWIAIFDGDDVSHPERLAKQITYLNNHPEVDYMGTECNPINKQTGEFMPDRLYNPPLSNGLIHWELCFHYPFHHSSTIGKRDLFMRAKGYPTVYPVCEDLFLWLEMSKQGAYFANIDEALLTYRVNTKPHHYALNQAIARQLHRRHIANILDTEVSEEIFSVIWQANAGGLHKPALQACSIHIVEAIGILTALYHQFQKQTFLTEEDKALVQTNLLGRIRNSIELTDPTTLHYQFSYQPFHLDSSLGRYGDKGM